MRNRGVARRILLPRFVVTELCDEGDPDALLVTEARKAYHRRPKRAQVDGLQRDGFPMWARHAFNFFPVVLDSDGVPWAEALIYIISCLESTPDPKIATYASIADDLAAFRRFLDQHGLDWTDFPKNKLERPTYRFRSYLKYSIAAGELASATARRRMGTVIAFYRKLEMEKVFVPAEAPWVEREQYLQFADRHGFVRGKVIKSTDLKINVPKTDDPFDGMILDGAKLRPLRAEEQEWVVDALAEIGNTEMTLIHVLALVTGARIQTALTLRRRHILRPNFRNRSEVTTMPGVPNPAVRVPVGYGTGVDTKFDKQMELHIPHWFFEKLISYANGLRGTMRRMLAVGGDCEDQYLFLSRRGIPFYQSKAESSSFNDQNGLRHVKSGQAVRQFITERVIPSIREAHGVTNFHYRFHDLRATAGMNLTDYQLQLVAKGQTTLLEAREYVRLRMGHESSETTERYLKFRYQLAHIRWVEERHEEHLRDLCERGMKGQL
ncbi:site-specific integrase [Paraburkholderia sediminicola]|uniref:site-specific integrase n=1 Tax=Paraburkholderia TaxID=1822464 RepID=UPI0038B7C017